ncbi:Ti-type conjugative transfer relaxase TraA [Brucella pituitosa]|uniref:Ti-type conjugative transfer relaxase TraA n=1 Tax=Brucella pituitosa TaxID=571256 RepID=UPI0012FDE1B8|nr:Ti-type conjugative transfer relaxase TraA [Brucella pituitosa]
MAIAHFRVQIIGAARSAIDAAAYRHRTRMYDELKGGVTRCYDDKQDLVHEEVAIPEGSPQWITDMVEGVDPDEASQTIWNKITMEERANGQLAREIVVALPVELTREQNIDMMRDYVAQLVTAKGMVADWVYHEPEGNPHVHLMHTLRPVAEEGFGKKSIPVLDENGQPLRRGPRQQIVHRTVIGGLEQLKEWRNVWGEVVNHHLAMAGHDVRIDMRSYAEQGIDIEPTKHLGPAGTAIKRKIGESQMLDKREAERRETAQQLIAKPGELLKLISRERSTFSERDIAKTLHRFIDDPETFANVRAAVMASPELVELRGNVRDPETNKLVAKPAYSTKEMVRIEHDMAVSADRLNRRSDFGVKDKRVLAAIRAVEQKDPSRPFRFDAEQVLAVQHVTGKSGIAAVVGYAGAGKSTLLEAANAAWVANGNRVFGAALAGKAAEGLEESAGITSRTLASWELSWKNERDLLQPGDVFVIDEAGMVASNQLSRFITTIEKAGAKAVLVGDAMQLQPIEAGAAFRAITERVSYVELVGVRRQKAAWAQEASRQFARGEVREALEAYRDHGHIRIADDKDKAIEAIVADWSQARSVAQQHAIDAGKSLRGDELLVLAHTNASVLELNTAIREVMRDQGALSEERVFVTERGKRDFAVGDRFIFLKNEKFHDALAPELGPQRVKNGMLGNVIATSNEAGRPMLRVRLDNGREVAFSSETYCNVDHGYAATVHKSQGVTVDQVFVLGSKSMDQHLSYVAMSRHRHEVTLYAAQDEFGVRQAGKLVDHGVAPFENDSANRDSYFVTVENDKGEQHTTWGVGLEKAIAQARCEIGEQISLRHEGSEQVTLPDGTETHRNSWSVNSSDDQVFDRLAKSMSRCGAKTTTLDFGHEAGYRSVVDGFAARHGIETLTSIAPSFAAFVEKQSAWISEKREQLTHLWSRVEKVLGRTKEQNVVVGEEATAKAALQPASSQAASAHELSKREPGKEAQVKDQAENQSASQTVAADAAVTEQAIKPPLFAAVTSFADTVEEAARAHTRENVGYVSYIKQLRELAPRIWRDPETAVARIEQSIATATEADRLAALLKDDPSRAGALRGSDRLVDRFGAAGAERKEALGLMPMAMNAVRMAESSYMTVLPTQLDIEQHRRRCMAIEVPALSNTAEASVQAIAKIEDRRQRDYAVLKLNPEIKTELREFTKTLEKRFGPKAFEHPDPKLIANVAHSEKAKFSEIAKQLQTVRQVMNTDIEQRFLAERMQKSLSRSTGITH